MTQILAIKPGALSTAGIRKLSKAGVVVIECDDPAGLRLIDCEAGSVTMPAGDMLYAALDAVANTYTESGAGHRFAKNLASRMARRIADVEKANG